MENQDHKVEKASFSPDPVLLSDLIQSLPLNVYAKDNEGRFIFANQTYCQNTHKQLNEIIDKTDYEIHPGKLAEKYLADDKRIRENRLTEFYEEPWQSIGGEKKYIQIIKAPLTSAQDNNVIGTIGIFWDITERKLTEITLAEERNLLRTLIDTLPSYIYVKDDHCRFIIANEAVAKLMGAKGPDDLLGKTDFDFYPYEVANRFFKHEQKLLSTEEPIFDLEELFYTPDGQKHHLLTTKSPLRNIEGDVVGFVGVGHDITELKQAEEERIKMKKLESVGILAGGIAHDFNNLLASILGNIELAERMVEPDHPSQERLKASSKAILRARELAERLLTFSSGGAPVRTISHLPDLLKESIDFALSGSNIVCHFDIEAKPWAVEMDHGQISQVVQNLIFNAKQAMPKGGVITAACSNKKLADGNVMNLKAGYYVKIDISDTGCGIPQANLKNIFDPYYTTKEGGSGLGLAISYSIISKHNGAITVASQEGEGATFTIYIPAIPKIQPDSVPSSEETLYGHGLILVMDDDENIREVLQHMLDHLGYQSLMSSHGLQAIDIYKKYMQEGTKIDAVIMDLTIPGGLGGKDTAEALLEIDPEAKIIVSSGYSTDPVMENYTELGFCGIVKKPFKIDVLSMALSQALIPADKQ